MEQYPDHSSSDIERLLVPIPSTVQTLGVGRSTVYHLIATGELTRVRIGSRSLITADSIHAYVDRLTKETR